MALVTFPGDIDIKRAATSGGMARTLDSFASGGRHVLEQGFTGRWLDLGVTSVALSGILF